MSDATNSTIKQELIDFLSHLEASPRAQTTIKQLIQALTQKEIPDRPKSEENAVLVVIFLFLTHPELMQDKNKNRTIQFLKQHHAFAAPLHQSDLQQSLMQFLDTLQGEAETQQLLADLRTLIAQKEIPNDAQAETDVVVLIIKLFLARPDLIHSRNHSATFNFLSAHHAFEPNPTPEPNILSKKRT